MDANYRFGGFGRGGDAAPAPECSKQGAHGERRTRDAEGAEDRGVEGGTGRRYPLPSRLGGLGSVVSSPSGIRGKAN